MRFFCNPLYPLPNGMAYLEHASSGQRGSWRYELSGKELLPKAKEKLEKIEKRIDALRTELGRMTNDRSVDIRSKKLDGRKKKLEELANLKAKLDVWIWAFDKYGERSFSLDMGDVAFFEFVPGAADEDDDNFEED